MASQQLGFNDVVLLISLLYACIDLGVEWEAFEACSRPIHKWLLVSYLCVVCFRLTHWLGTRALAFAAAAVASPRSNGVAAIAGELLLNLRHKEALPRAVAKLTWVVGLPFFSAWTFLGTYWMKEVLEQTPECMPTSIHLYFSLFWMLLCYAWVVIHAALGALAFILERRVRRAEGNLRDIEDDDLRRRWGATRQIAGFDEVIGGVPSNGDGLNPAEIKDLPSDVARSLKNGGLALKEKECSICLSEFEPGDAYRGLPRCGHAFHKSCIDLWLLRRAECPLCKTNVLASKP